MNECQQTSRLSAYHDGQMPPEERLGLERHLEQCPRCAAELGRIRQLSGLFQSMPVPALSPSALERLHKRVDLLPSTGIIHLAEALSAVAAMILVVCTLALTLRSSTSEAAGLPLWESQAVAQQPVELSSAGSEELVANWVVQDLSMRDERE